MTGIKRRASKRRIGAAVAFLAAAGAAGAVAELNFDELISVVFFEDEQAYKDPTGFFCRFIALKDKDDYCKVTLTYIEPKLCKVEVLRDMRVTWDNGKGREFLRSRDVFTLANVDLTKLTEPQVDDARGTSRQTFSNALNVKWHEGHQYTFALSPDGGYKACIVNGTEQDIPEKDCVAAGQQPYAGTKTMSLIFNTQNYNRSMAAIRWLQKNYCPAGDAL